MSNGQRFNHLLFIRMVKGILLTGYPSLYTKQEFDEK